MKNLITAALRIAALWQNLPGAVKKTVVTLLQLAVTLGALYWVFHKPQTRHDMAGALREASIPWLLAALVVGSLSPLAASIRLWLLLRVQDRAVSLWRMAQLCMTGMFFNLFLPGSTGGDAVKFFYLLRGSEPRRRAGIIFAIVMDRLLGLLALIIMASVFLVLRYRWLTQTRDTTNLVNAFTVIIFGAGGLIALVFVVVQLRLVDRLPAGMPGRTKLIEVASAVQVYTRAWPTTLGGIGISFVGHSSFFFTYYFASNALRAGVSFVDMAVLLPIVNTILALPISMSGVGVREKLFTTLLGDLCHVPAGQAATISVVGSIGTVFFYGLVGGIFYLFFRSAAGAIPAHVEEVEAREEEAALPDMIKEANGPAI